MTLGTREEVVRHHAHREGAPLLAEHESGVIARQLVARELRCSDKVLRDCLALAGRLADTNAAWTRFLAYLKTLPANQQRQLVTALPSSSA